MDHTFSSTGAIRQHHQQSVRNSLSPSPHNHLYHISSSPTSSILAAAAGISNLPFGKSSPTSVPAGNFGGAVTGYPQAPQSIINPGTLNSFRVPLVTQQQQQYHQQAPCNFSPTSGATNIPAENFYVQGNIQQSNRAVTGQYSNLRPTSGSSNSSGSSVNTRSPTNLGSSPASSFSSSKSSVTSPYHSTPLVENNYRNHQQQQQQPHQYQHHQFSNIHHQVPSQSHSQQLQLPNNQQNNMNKNRFVSPQQQPNVNGVSTADNGNNVASNIKVLIQQVSQPQQLQQNVSNVNTSSMGSPSNAITSQQNQHSTQQPQYRIFKRGDSIPGISSPIHISSAISSTSNESSNSITLQSGQVSGNLNSDGNPSVDSNNSTVVSSSEEGQVGTDKENITNNAGGNSGGANAVSRTPLSQIGEIARFHSATVEYRLIKETGPPHAPTFTVLLRLANEEYVGEGPSIKKAQHAAAVEALEKTALVKPPQKPKLKKLFNQGGAGAGGSKRPNWTLIQLTNLAQELQLQLQFVQQPVAIVDPFRRGEPPSVVAVHVGDKVFSAEGSNFNTAKNMAVMVALKAMLKVKQELELAKMVQAGSDAEQSLMDAENKSPISIVHEMAMKRTLTVAFDIVQESGPPHMKVFTVKCKVGEELETEGHGPTKQAAKKASSESMIAKLKEIPLTLTATSQGVNLKAMQRGLFRQKATKKKTSTPVVKDLEKQTVSPISRLIQIAHIKKLKEPEFTLISTGTESNVENFLKQITERDRRMLRKKKPVFTIEVTIGTHTCRGTGSNKKAAKKAAAEAAIIAMGYGPTEDFGEGESDEASQAGGATSLEETTSSASTKNNATGGKGSNGGNNLSNGKANANSNPAPGPSVRLTGARQIAPGVIVLKSETPAGTATSSAAVQEMKKVNTMMTPCPAASNREGIEKLAYLSRLLEIAVSYSDFPKKNEYLSVVSLTTNPPHVAHGCGATLEEAQNAVSIIYIFWFFVPTNLF